MLTSAIYVSIGCIVIFFLFSKRVKSNRLWSATITPLASIIGSGFLIAAPVFNELGGNYAPILMTLLCLISFGLGEVIRWNISDIEPVLEQNKKSEHMIILNERIGDTTLIFAYVLSITYYLYLLTSFIVKMLGISSPYTEKIIVTIIYMMISLLGYKKGLSSLEKVESTSVNIKISIIFIILLSLFVYGLLRASGTDPSLAFPSELLNFDSLATSLGLLVMVQGFETSRYLREEYEQAVRIKSMRYAQILSSIIYILLIVLFMPVFRDHPIEIVTETSVIDISKFIFVLAPTLLFIAAMASQLSAALADMAGGGGLASELSKGRISSRLAYIIISTIGIILVWLFNIFEIISYASKLFALYYFFQCLSSIIVSYKKNWRKVIFSIFMSIVCLMVIFWGKAFE